MITQEELQELLAYQSKNGVVISLYLDSDTARENTETIKHQVKSMMREADVVIAHAGCGSALAALKAGKYPVLIARDPAHGEVVDEHQIEIARWLSEKELALERTADSLTFEALETAATRSVVRLATPPAFRPRAAGWRWPPWRGCWFRPLFLVTPARSTPWAWSPRSARPC